MRRALVLSFFRGGWCSFRTAELCALLAAEEEFNTSNADLVVLDDRVSIDGIVRAVPGGKVSPQDGAIADGAAVPVDSQG